MALEPPSYLRSLTTLCTRSLRDLQARPEKSRRRAWHLENPLPSAGELNRQRGQACTSNILPRLTIHQFS